MRILIIVVVILFLALWVGAVIDVFRRSDLSGLAKLGWIVGMLVFPFIGLAVYTLRAGGQLDGLSRLPAAPLVSVIVICHDYGRFLAEAVDSALGQTYPNCEVVVIDDGSTDDSVEVAGRYGDAIRLLTQSNQGLERTCNRAVAEARGELFVLLSADDVLEPTYVEELLGALRGEPDAAFAYCRARMFGGQTGLTKSFPYSPFLLVRRMNFVNASALTRREDYLVLGGYAEEIAGNTLEDWDFWLRMLEHGKRGTFVRAPLLRWRRHTTGSRNVQDERTAARVAVIRGRHEGLAPAVRGVGGTLSYLFDLGVAATDLALGLSRRPGVVRALERSSWRRYRRRQHRLERRADEPEQG